MIPFFSAFNITKWLEQGFNGKKTRHRPSYFLVTENAFHTAETLSKLFFLK